MVQWRKIFFDRIEDKKMVYEIRCAWCEKSMGVKECESSNLAVELEKMGVPVISHGICIQCRDHALENIVTKYEKRPNKNFAAIDLPESINPASHQAGN